MGSRIENLGDYNKAREAVQAAGGSLSEVYKRVGETAVAKASPKYILIGIAIGVTVSGAAIACYKGVKYLIHRKQKMENEPALKKEFIEAVQNEEYKGNYENIGE